MGNIIKVTKHCIGKLKSGEGKNLCCLHRLDILERCSSKSIQNNEKGFAAVKVSFFKKESLCFANSYLDLETEKGAGVNSTQRSDPF